MTITLRNTLIEVGTWEVTIKPGDLSPEQSIASVATPINMIAGNTYLFPIIAKDVYANLITEGGHKIDVIALF